MDTAEDDYTLHDTRTERGTRFLFGKAYHWGMKGGSLVLLRGPDPRTTDFGAVAERETR